MARVHHNTPTTSAESSSSQGMEPGDDWATPALTPKQQEAETLRSILADYVRDGHWRSEPQQRRAVYAWNALFGRGGPGVDDW